MIGAAGFMQAPKAEEKKSVAFLAGMEAKKTKVPLKKSAIKNLMVGSKQYFDFLDGYDFKEVQL